MIPFNARDLHHVSDLIDALSVLVKNYQIYGIDHPRAEQGLRDFLNHCSRVRELEGCNGLDLLISSHEGQLFLQNMPLPEQPSAAKLIKQLMFEGEQDGFNLQLNLTEKQIAEMLEHLNKKRDSTTGFKWLTRSQIVSQQGSSVQSNTRANLLLGLEDLNIDVQLCDRMLTSLSSFMEDCSDNGEADVSPLLKAGDELVEKFGTSASDILPITTVPYYDDFTYHHSINVALLSMTAAQHLVDNQDQLRRICQAALLHDLGKSLVPSEILYKPGRLDETEFRVIENHPVAGAEMLMRFPDMDPLAVSVAFAHHIKEGGNGYPKVSKSFRLSPLIKLVEVVDIFEALTAHRPYKKPLSSAQAFEILYSMPHMDSFRPYMDLLVRAIGLNPVGSRVKTADGEVAVVVGHQDNDPLQPIVKPVRKNGNDGVYLDKEAIHGVVGPSSCLSNSESAVLALTAEEENELLGSLDI